MFFTAPFLMLLGYHLDYSYTFGNEGIIFCFCCVLLGYFNNISVCDFLKIFGTSFVVFSIFCYPKGFLRSLVKAGGKMSDGAPFMMLTACSLSVFPRVKET